MSDLTSPVNSDIGNNVIAKPGEVNLSDNSITKDFPGRTAQIIGSGKFAQQAIVWHVIKWCFGIAAIISGLLFILFIWKGKPDLIDSLKIIWAIFVPIITLALGYVFGKGKD